VFAGQALPYAYALLLARTASRAGVSPSLAVPLALPIAFSLTPMMFPFRPSAPIVEMLPFAQIADLGGASLVDLATAAVGCAILEAMRTRRPAVIALAFVLFAAPMTYGLVRIPEVEAARARAPSLRVGIVQPNVSIEAKQSLRFRRPTMYTLRTLSHQAEARGAELIVWPETSYPYRIAPTRERDPLGDPGIRRDGLHTPVIFGVVTGTHGCDQANAVVGMRRDGTLTRPVDKVRLLPFVETFPGWEQSRILTRVRPCFGYRAGPRARTIDLENLRVGILNCYEDLLGEHSLELATLRPDFLLNVTNDAWFLDSQEPHLHHMVARLRAIELRRDLVRSVNTGVSGLTSATGARLLQTETYVAVAPVVRVHMLRETTIYARFGEITLYVAIMALLLATVLASSAPQPE
jgi:apolipoprotein N-acyltransferase